MWKTGLLLVLGFVLVLWVSSYRPAAGQQRTEILWDTYGVPHIYGKDNKQLFHAFGWAQMQSHGNLILRLYGRSRGRAAEYWGEKYVESDQWVRTMGVPDRAHQWYKAQNPTFRSYLDAFAAGVNAYAQKHADLIDDTVKVVLPITAEDILAHTQHVLHFTFVVDPERVASLSEPEPVSQIKPSERSLGSNAWAIAPARSASGNAMLLANPHTPWSDLFLWYEAQLTAPGIDAYGSTLVGVPVLAIAFNDFLGWSHTVNTHDGWDAYELQLTQGGYRWDQTVQAFDSQVQALKIKQADGIRTEPLKIQRSIHGPVVAETDSKAIALRVVGLDQPGVLEQWWDMARATQLSEFEAALQRLQLPMFTVMYADRAGHIMQLFNGQVPIRSQGNFEDWAGLIPGDTSTTLWKKTHAYRDLPRIVNPSSGWLQNANDPPWTTTFPQALNPNDYPAYLAPRGPMDFRAQRSARLLMAEPKISLAQMIQAKHSTRMELADRLLDDLIPAAKQGSALAQRAAKILDKWDRQANADSRGAVLFALWEDAVDLDEFLAIPWQEQAPLTTPDGIKHAAAAVAALETVAAQVESTYGALDVPWGDVFRLRYGKVDLPANGGPGSLGIFRTLRFQPETDETFKAIAGEAYVAAIEFSNPVKAKVLTSYGNATQPNSSHVGDQLELFARQELRPVWRSRPDIEVHLESRKVF